jgi:hypothetical protein
MSAAALFVFAAANIARTAALTFDESIKIIHRFTALLQNTVAHFFLLPRFGQPPKERNSNSLGRFVSLLFYESSAVS